MKPNIFSVTSFRQLLPRAYRRTSLCKVLLYQHGNNVRTLSCKMTPALHYANNLWTTEATQTTRSNSQISRTPDMGILRPRSRNYSTVSSEFTDYEAERRNFKLDVPEYYNFSRDVIDKWAAAEKSGDRAAEPPAFWWVDKDGSEVKWSYQDLAAKSNRVANIFTKSCGLKKGDTVIVILPKIPQWWLINIAAIRSGVVMSPGTIMLREKDILHRLMMSRASCIIADSNTAHLVDKVAGESPYLKKKVFVNSKTDRQGWLNFEDLYEKESEEFECVNTRGDDPMTLFFTSGTTGAPKMAEHTHVSYPIGHVITTRYFLLLTPQSVIWNMSDPGWAKSAYSNVFSPWISGSCVFIYNFSAFDPADTLKVLSDYPISHFCNAPTAYRSLVKLDLSHYSFPHLRHCLSAGEPVNPEVIEAWKKGTGQMLYEGYGQTETTLLCGNYKCVPPRVSSMGKASPGVDLQIVDEEGNVLPRGEEGELGVRCKPHRPVGLFSKYVEDPERTASRFKGDFYLTGDRAYMDKDDYIYFVGRADDVIISAGYRIGPFEVESALLEHPAVLESAVVSSPDTDRGEVVKAFIVLTAEYQKVDTTELVNELQKHVKTITAPYKYPRKIEFVEELPKTVSGKIRRIELRNKEWGK